MFCFYHVTFRFRVNLYSVILQMSRNSFVKTSPISEFSVTVMGFGHRFEWFAKWFSVLYEPSGFGFEFHCNYIILIYVKDTLDYFWEGNCVLSILNLHLRMILIAMEIGSSIWQCHRPMLVLRQQVFHICGLSFQVLQCCW